MSLICDTGFAPPNLHKRLQWKPVDAITASLIMTIYGPRDSRYRFFSSGVKSGHKMYSLTAPLGVRGPQERNGLQAAAAAQNPVWKMTSAQFMTPIPLCEVTSEVPQYKHTHLHLSGDCETGSIV